MGRRVSVVLFGFLDVVKFEQTGEVKSLGCRRQHHGGVLAESSACHVFELEVFLP